MTKDKSRQILVIGIFLVCVNLFCGCSERKFLEKKKPEAKKVVVRPAAVAGTFYPQDKEELLNLIETFFKEVPLVKKPKKSETLLAIGVPHAGYIYSGKIAAYAYKHLTMIKPQYIVLLGQAHYYPFSGIAIDTSDYYSLPFGRVKVALDLAKRLINWGKINKLPVFSLPEAHQMDHSLEVQIPFLQYVLGDIKKEEFKFSIIPILVGNISSAQEYLFSRCLYEEIFSKNNALLVVSTDLSHYPPYDLANKIDKDLLRVIEKGSVTLFKKELNVPYPQVACRCCAPSAVAILLNLTSFFPKGLRIDILAYANSGDAAEKRRENVVGYSAITVYYLKEKKEKELFLPPKKMSQIFQFSEQEKKFLINIARNTLENYIREKRIPPLSSPPTEYKSLYEKYGVFVTLKNPRAWEPLRGCIGSIIGNKPLYQGVQEMTYEAIHDPRFVYNPITEEELPHIEIEITVLSPLRRISNINEIEIGRHGVYLVKDGRSGVFLPQVPLEQGWRTHKEYLTHLSLKAGLPPDAYLSPETELFVFEGYIIKEEK
jgi:AmmeMemoRadiSam system protein B/AmmeMemoRadiSam system protein A